MEKSIPSYNQFLTLLEDVNTIDDLQQWLGKNNIIGTYTYRDSHNLITLTDTEQTTVIAPNLAADDSGHPKFLLAKDNTFLCQKEG